MLQWEPFAGGHIGPGGRSVRQRRAGRDGARPLQRWSRPMAAGCVTESAQRRADVGIGPYERRGLRRGVVTPPYGCITGGTQRAGRCT